MDWVLLTNGDKLTDFGLLHLLRSLGGLGLEHEQMLPNFPPADVLHTAFIFLMKEGLLVTSHYHY